MISFLRRVGDIISCLPCKSKIISMIVIVQLTVIILPVLTGNVIDNLSVSGNDQQRRLGLLLIGLLALFALGWVARYYLGKQLIRNLLAFEKNLRLRLWDGFEHMALGTYETTPAGILHSKMSRDISALSTTIQILSEVFFSAIIVSIGAVAFTLYFQPWFLFVVGVVSLAYVGIYYIFRQRIESLTCAAHASNEGLHQLTLDFIEMIPMFRVFGVMGLYKNNFEKKIDDNTKSNNLLNNHNVKFATVVSIVSDIGKFSVLAIAIFFCIQDRITVGDVVVYQSLFSQALEGISRIVFMLPSLHQGYEALTSIHPHLAVQVQAQIESDPDWGPDGHLGSVRFEKVDFTYPHSATKALVAVTCTIEPGEHVIILGQNGSGKSTFARLILGYYAPDRGCVLVDGRATTASTGEKSARVAYVPQVPKVYRDTLLENIRLRKTSIPPEVVQEATRRCNLVRLADDLYREIGAYSLSGGEMQCVAIARALVTKPSVIVLDEISSHLDITSKNVIFDVLRDMHGECTIITITHDIEFIGIADRIFIIDEGSIYEVNAEKTQESIKALLDSFSRPQASCVAVPVREAGCS